MRKVTLCFLVDNNRICLAMKKRGFGVGKWNGVGGKVREEETVEAAAIRELKEEIGVETHPHHLEGVGNIKFYFNEQPDWNQHMHIFFIREWFGDPIETEEMAPQWYDRNKLPYESMWVTDTHWLPKVLEGKKIEGEVYFAGEGDEIEKFDFRELQNRF